LRRILLYSLMLLAGAAVFCFVRPALTRLRGTAGPGESVDITIVSLGTGCLGVAMAEGNLGAKIVAGDYFLAADRSQPCLLVTTFGPDMGLRSVHRFNLAGSFGAIADFIEFCRSQPADTVVAMSVNGTIELPRDARAAHGVELAKAEFMHLGVKARPYESERMSWAFLCIRRENRWQPIMEHVSNSHGVRLSLVLESDITRYDNIEGAYVDESSDEQEIHLLNYVSRAWHVGHRISISSARGAAGTYPATARVPAYAMGNSNTLLRSDRSLIWTDMALGSHPRFECGAGLDLSGAGPAVCRMLVDGRCLSALELPGAAPGYEKWKVNLGDFANGRVDLELRVTAGRGASNAVALLRDPVLLFGTPAARDDTGQAGLGEKHSVVFIGHAYSFNGFDKNRYKPYIVADPALFAGRALPYARRIRDELVARNTALFYGRADELGGSRLVWGGDVVYGPTPGSVAHFLGLANRLDKTPQVLVPGNHDWEFTQRETLPNVFHAVGTSSEIIGNVRVVYADTVTDRGKRMNAQAACHPLPAWISDLVRKMTLPERGHSVLVFMHHAPWIEEERTANVSHKDCPWWNRVVHPALVKARKESGRDFYIIAGDGGTGCLADGRQIDGIHYVVTGPPRFDDHVANGFVEISWSGESGGLSFTVHAWKPDRGFLCTRPDAFPWRVE